MNKKIMMAALLTVACAPASAVDWRDLLKQAQPLVQQQAADASIASLTSEETVAGLKEALSTGTRHAVKLLSRDGGYLNDAAVRIPMPSSLRTVEQGVRAMGQGAIIDRFIKSMNSAAERAAPEAAEVFGDAIARMSVRDAMGILNGPQDAATQYFRRSSEGRLMEVMRPIVTRATGEAQVTAAYKGLIKQAGFLASMLGQESLDLDAYVTRKSLDGLFLKLAEQERLIRENPAARSSDLLKRVFGAVRR